jgi:hypothetical protein
MNSSQMTPLSGRTSCHPFLPLNTPMNPIEIKDVEIEISGVSSMAIDGRRGGGQPPLPRKKKEMWRTNLQHGTISLGIKVLLIMIS